MEFFPRSINGEAVINGEVRTFLKIYKRGGCNKRGGKNILENVINGEALIRVSRVEKVSKNK